MKNRLEKLILKQPEYPERVKKELAAVTGLSTESINRYCRNRESVIDARIAIVMADFFQVTVKDLYEETRQISKRSPKIKTQ